MLHHGKLGLTARHQPLQLSNHVLAQRCAGPLEYVEDAGLFLARREQTGQTLHHGFSIEQKQAGTADQHENHDECNSCDTHKASHFHVHDLAYDEGANDGHDRGRVEQLAPNSRRQRRLMVSGLTRYRPMPSTTGRKVRIQPVSRPCAVWVRTWRLRRNRSRTR